jgi:hypothetical protein
MKAKIAAALAEDAACRHPGVTEGLYELSQLAPFARLEEGIPMVFNPGVEKLNRATGNAEYQERLEVCATFLATLEYRKLGLRLAGGAASSILMHDPDESRFQAFQDYDLFLVGHKSDLEAKEAINALASHLSNYWESIEVYRTPNCITFFTPNYPPKTEARPYTSKAIVQVILRRYSTDAEVIHGFDMGSSAIMWDGARVRMTALGKLAAEHGVNVLNLAARRASYESRLARYFDRGFDLVLPELDGAALLFNRGRLPYLSVCGARVSNNPGDYRILAWSLQATRPDLDARGRPVGRATTASKESEEVPESDYAFGKISYGNPDALVAQNIRALAREKPAALCAFGKYAPGLDIFGLKLQLDLERFCGLIETFFKADGSVSVMSLNTILGPQLAFGLVFDYMSTKQRPARETIKNMCTQRLAALTLHADIPFRFMTVEDKTALTGPFTREVVTTAQWYGAAHHGL